MVNYYEILEVSEKASKEVIDKAYKALAKKYHPDLNHDKPKEAELKMKQLNEAFDVLMDDNKRANFDSVLAKHKEMEMRKQQQQKQASSSQPHNTYANNINQNVNNYNRSTVNNIENANTILYSKNGYYTDQNGNFYVDTRNMDEKTKQKLQAQLQEKYLEAYDAYLRQHGYKLKYKWTFKRVMQLVLAILIAIVIFTILFFIPPIHDYCMEIYEENIIIHLIVNLISAFLHAVFSIFT